MEIYWNWIMGNSNAFTKIIDILSSENRDSSFNTYVLATKNMNI